MWRRRTIVAASFGREKLCRPFLYRCPNTGYKVQGFIIAEDVSDDSEDYRALTCLACQQVHYVSPTTGKVLGEEEE